MAQDVGPPWEVIQRTQKRDGEMVRKKQLVLWQNFHSQNKGLLPACEMSTPLKFHSSTHENYRPKHKREASSSSQFLFRDELLNFGPSVLVEYDLPKDV